MSFSCKVIYDWLWLTSGERPARGWEEEGCVTGDSGCPGGSDVCHLGETISCAERPCEGRTSCHWCTTRSESFLWIASINPGLRTCAHLVWAVSFKRMCRSCARSYVHLVKQWTSTKTCILTGATLSTSNNWCHLVSFPDWPLLQNLG